MIDVWICATANGVKPVILLEEMGLPYRCHSVNLMAGEHRAPELLAINPMGKVPMLLDPDGPDGAPISMGESGTMANYLVAKTGLLGGKTARETTEIDYWCQATNATIAAMMARKFWITFLAPEKVPSIIEAVEAECLRYFQGFEDRLADGRTFLVGDRFHHRRRFVLAPHPLFRQGFLSVGQTPFPALQAYHDVLFARPSVARAVDVVRARLYHF